jgi:hypothetical protein
MNNFQLKTVPFLQTNCQFLKSFPFRAFLHKLCLQYNNKMRTYNKTQVLFINFSPTCFGTQCAIFRENFFLYAPNQHVTTRTETHKQQHKRRRQREGFVPSGPYKIGTMLGTYIATTYLLTPWNRVLLQKLTGFVASQEIPLIYGTRKFITVPTTARPLSLS